MVSLFQDTSPVIALAEFPRFEVSISVLIKAPGVGEPL